MKGKVYNLMLENKVLQQVLKAVYAKHTDDNTACIWFCAPVEVRDSDSKVIPAFTPIQIPVTYTCDSLCEVLNLKAGGSKSGLTGIIEKIVTDTTKNGFTSANLSDLDSEFYYLSTKWVKQSIEVTVYAMSDVLSHLRRLESIYDDSLKAYSQTVIDNLDKTSAQTSQTGKTITGFKFTMPKPEPKPEPKPA